MRREEESMLRVVMQLNKKGNRPRGNTTWLDNIDRHQKGKNTSLREVLRTKCFENRHDWRTLISRSTDRNSGVDHWAPSRSGGEQWASFSSPADHDSVHDAQMQEYILLRHVWLLSILEPTASSWFLDRGFIYATGSPPLRNQQLPTSRLFINHALWSYHANLVPPLRRRIQKGEKNTKFSWTI